MQKMRPIQILISTKGLTIRSSLLLLKKCCYPIDQAVYHGCGNTVGAHRAPQQENIFAPTPKMKPSACVNLGHNVLYRNYAHSFVGYRIRLKYCNFISFVVVLTK